MSNLQTAVHRTDIHHFSIRGFLSGLGKRWNSVSGFNTQSPYSGISERDLFREKTPDRSALFDSLDILIQYIENLLVLRPEEGNYDINLKTRLEIKQTEMSPLLPDNCRFLGYDERGAAFSIYQMVIRIHSELLLLQDLFHVMGKASRYRTILEYEKNIVKITSSELRRFCQGQKEYQTQSSDLHASLRGILDNFDIEMTDLRDSPTADSANIEDLEIMKTIERMGDRNKTLYKRILEISENGRS